MPVWCQKILNKFFWFLGSFFFGAFLFYAGFVACKMGFYALAGNEQTYRAVADISATVHGHSSPGLAVYRREENKFYLNNFIPGVSVVPAEGKTIIADLGQMHLYLYLDGQLQASSTIASKGRPGTAWETPVGEYQILAKNPKHFSSLGSVYMPYSLQFFGNYFIHGWPYYPNGQPVPAGYSGGCIRLSDQLAKQVYDFADLGTKVMIYGADRLELSDKTSSRLVGDYFWRHGPRTLTDIGAEAYLVADIDTGEVLVERGVNDVWPIASVTKLMTALVSLETLNQYQTTTVSKRAIDTYGTYGNLRVGEKIVVGDLLFPLLLESSNDASEVLAEHGGRQEFIAQMNKKAKAIGMKQTSFADPSGLSENNTSTVSDLLKMMQYIFSYKHYILDISREKFYQLGRHHWNNYNNIANVSSFLGGKNGYTDEAQRTLAAIFSLPLSEFENRHIAVIILKSEDRRADTLKILDFVQDNIFYQFYDNSVRP